MEKIINKIKAFFQIDIVSRLSKTFIQAFLGVIFAANYSNINIDTLKVIIIAGASAGISAIWNTLILIYNKKVGK